MPEPTYIDPAADNLRSSAAAMAITTDRASDTAASAATATTGADDSTGPEQRTAGLATLRRRVVEYKSRKTEVTSTNRCAGRKGCAADSLQ